MSRAMTMSGFTAGLTAGPNVTAVCADDACGIAAIVNASSITRTRGTRRMMHSLLERIGEPGVREKRRVGECLQERDERRLFRAGEMQRLHTHVFVRMILATVAVVIEHGLERRESALVSLR